MRGLSLYARKSAAFSATAIIMIYRNTSEKGGRIKPSFYADTKAIFWLAWKVLK